MPKRVTVILDDEIYDEVQRIRGELILKTKRNISMSQMVNILLRSALKKDEVKLETYVLQRR